MSEQVWKWGFPLGVPKSFSTTSEVELASYLTASRLLLTDQKCALLMQHVWLTAKSFFYLSVVYCSGKLICLVVQVV